MFCETIAIVYRLTVTKQKKEQTGILRLPTLFFII